MTGPGTRSTRWSVGLMRTRAIIAMESEIVKTREERLEERLRETVPWRITDEMPYWAYCEAMVTSGVFENGQEGER